MIQRSQHFRFALKSGESLGIMRESFRQDLDGHVAPELGVVRLIHFTHPARADWCEDFVRAEMCANREGHFFSPAVQLTTTVMGAEFACWGIMSIRNRWPSADTAYE